MKKKIPITREGAFLMAANLCAKSEYCETEIKKRLHRWGINTIDINHIIDELYRNRFLDEYRFASSYAKDKYRFNGWGTRKIRFYLKNYGINTDAIETGIDSIDQDEYKECLFNQLIKKNSNHDLTNYEQRAKVFNHLKNRGYETELIWEAINKLMNSDASD